MIPYEKKERYTVEDLMEIVSLLRSENGCPWDKVQTHQSIRTDLIEETYEVIEAIDQDDPAMLREELGDLLLQVAFHTSIEEERQRFTREDVYTEICEKLITRHPHVFSTVQADTTEEVLTNWDAIKEASKHQTTRTQTVEAVPKTFPALMRGQKTFKRAVKGDTCMQDTLSGDFLVTACKEALAQLNFEEMLEKTAGEQMGYLLFCLAALSHKLGISAEQALTDTTNRFVDLFAKAEASCLSEGKALTQCTEADWAAFWQQFQKKEED